eukprot:408751-Prymnesium_polylepis.2
MLQRPRTVVATPTTVGCMLARRRRRTALRPRAQRGRNAPRTSQGVDVSPAVLTRPRVLRTPRKPAWVKTPVNGSSCDPVR